MHPERMSMPCTCPHHDWLMYILYCSDAAFISQVISTAASGVEEEHGTEAVREAVRLFMPSARDSVDSLRIKLLVLLDQDEGTRRRLCQYTCKSVRDYTSLSPEKASRFYSELHFTLIPDWVKDETVEPGDFVDRVRMAYLIS